MHDRGIADTYRAPRWGHQSRQRSLSPLNTQRRAATRSPPRPVARLSTRYLSRGRIRGDTHPPRRSRSRRHDTVIVLIVVVPHRSRSPREHLRQRSRWGDSTPWTRMPEQRQEPPEEARHAAPTYPDRVGTQASECDTGARMEPRAPREPMMPTHGKGPRAIHNPAHLASRIHKRWWALAMVTLASWLPRTMLTRQ